MTKRPETIASYPSPSVYAPSTAATKHQRDGYVYKERGSRSTVKMPLFCPYEKCRRPTSTVDDGYILKHGVCGNCYVMYIEGRKTPLIDSEAYAQRFKERGF